MTDAAYGYCKDYLCKDGKPWFPVMGEMHYSRYRKELWEESLRKIKAGGISIVSTYVIWIHHEEEEGSFDFSDCRDIRTFLELCQKVGLLVFLRIGPFVHGEVRNGGFPDWLVQKEKKGLPLRCNHPEYLNYVSRFWNRVYERVEGCMQKDGGPVIGIQIENEYGHVGGLQGPEGEAHMRKLTEMAKEIGFQVPLYTATGWGGACIGDLLPVMGGYCEAPWDQRTCELEPNNNFVFSHTRNDSLIACDHHVDQVNTYCEEDFPYLTAELGGGLQVTGHRRPVASGKDVGAMSTVKLGSGAGMLGYYMYHGGSNPEGKCSTLQESRETGYLNDLPEINYDFNAPIRQYGTISDSYREIKLLSYFLQDFGADMAALKAEIPAEQIWPGDMTSLRTSCRHDREHGYVFFNNYQRRYKMIEHRQVRLKGLLGNADGKDAGRKNILFPAFDLKEGMYGFFPYRMKLGSAILRSALATPLCRLKTKERDTYVFYSEVDPQIEWETEETADILMLTRQEALNAYRIQTDQEYLIVSSGYVWEEEGRIRAVGGKDTIIAVYPELQEEMKGFQKCGVKGRFTLYERKESADPAKVQVNCIEETKEGSVYDICMVYPETIGKAGGVMDQILYMNYQGERMNVFAEGKKINDYFYTGQEAVLSLRYFDFPEKITVKIAPLHKQDKIFLEKQPEFKNGVACSLAEVRMEEQIY